jgi:diguanylate cyclase (GGDEF)-like protein/excisionase family DNA binding protein
MVDPPQSGHGRPAPVRHSPRGSARTFVLLAAPPGFARLALVASQFFTLDMTAAPDRRPADATLSVAKAAQVLGVHPNTIRAWSEQGRLRCYRINARGDRRYRVGDLRRFLSDAAQGPAQAANGRRPAGRISAAPRSAPSRPTGQQAGRAPRAAPVIRIRPGASSDTGARFGTDEATAGGLVGPNAARQLADLAILVASGRELERILPSAARMVREATHAAGVVIWEMRADRLVHRASSAESGNRSAQAVPNSGLGAKALAQRRPIVESRPMARKGVTPRARAGASAASRNVLDIAVPIVTDQGWGAIAVRLTRGLPSGDATVSWLEAAAALLAASVRLAALIGEAAWELHRADALRRVALDTNGTLDLDETLARLVDHAMTLFAADRGAVFVRRPDGLIEAEVSRGLSSAYLDAARQSPTPSLPAAAAEARRPLFATGYRDDQRSRAFRAAVDLEGFDTICAAPLLDGDEIVGLLILYHDRPRQWVAPELETMAAFASQATVAVRSSQQYTQMARWAAQLQSIQQLGVRLNRLTTVPEIAAAIATELQVVIKYDNIRVYRLEGNDLNVVALHSSQGEYSHETPHLVRSRVGRGITGWVAAHGVAVNLPDAAADPRSARIPGTSPLDESMLLAPTIFEDRVLGVIVLARRGLRQFGDDDLRLLEIYASVAAQAIANAEATERLRGQSTLLERQLKSQRELLRITESILSTLDPRAVLAQITERLGRLVRFDTMAIEVYERRSGMLTPLTARGPDGPAAAHSAAADPLAAWVIDHNEARLVRGDGASGSVSSQIVAPLRGRDGVTGLLTLARSPDLSAFSADELELVQLFAAQVSIALQNAEAHRALEVRARTDDLTGLLNHGSLREWLHRSEADGTSFSLIMLDLDAFKTVNDAFGHQAGDRLLTQIGAAIVAAGRDSDLVFRYGGDEFAVLLPGATATGAMQAAERIREAVHRVGAPSDGSSEGLAMTASIGVATYPADGSSGADILLAADRACFVAKRTGRDRIADAAKGLALAAAFSLQQPTPVDSPSRGTL